MKIAFLAPRFHSNQFELVKYLSKENHKCVFFVTRIGNSEDYRVLKPRLIQFSFIFHLIKKIAVKKRLEFDYFYGIPSIKQINEFRKEKFDVIIIRNPYCLISFIFSVLSLIFHVKIIFYTQREIFRKPNPLKDYFIKFLIIIFNAKWISPCLGNRKYKKNIPEFCYVPFCINPYKYDKVWFLNEKINIVSVGKFVPRKNHHLLINALIPLASKEEIKLTIVGEVSDVTGTEYFNEILNMAKKAPFEVEILTNMERSKLLEIYKRNDIFVLASTNEPASVSNLEAMAYGLPIITSSSNKTSSYTQGNGYVFRSGSQSDLTTKLDSLISNKNVIIRKGKKSWQIVKENHSPEDVYNYFANEICFN